MAEPSANSIRTNTLPELSYAESRTTVAGPSRHDCGDIPRHCGAVNVAREAKGLDGPLLSLFNTLEAAAAHNVCCCSSCAERVHSGARASTDCAHCGCFIRTGVESACDGGPVSHQLRGNDSSSCTHDRDCGGRRSNVGCRCEPQLSSSLCLATDNVEPSIRAG